MHENGIGAMLLCAKSGLNDYDDYDYDYDSREREGDK